MAKNKQLGRKPLPFHLKRIPCHGIRLPEYWVFWLKQHKRMGGRMIEEALREHFKPDEDQIIREFYGNEGGK